MSFVTVTCASRSSPVLPSPAAVLASGAMVWASSCSAFSATTTSPTNNWSALAGTLAAAFRTFKEQVIGDSPFLYWRLDETSGTTMPGPEQGRKPAGPGLLAGWARPAR